MRSTPTYPTSYEACLPASSAFPIPTPNGFAYPPNIIPQARQEDPFKSKYSHHPLTRVAPQVIYAPVVYQLPKYEIFPIAATCNNCHNLITTRIEFSMGSKSWIVFMIFALLFPIFACFICFINSLKDVKHFCPICSSHLGTYYR